MLLDLSVIATAYVCMRTYESYRSRKKRLKTLIAKSKNYSMVVSRQAMTIKERRYYKHMSLVTMGTAATRMLYPVPGLIALNIAVYTYTMLPFYREVENALRYRLLQEGRIDSYVLMGFGNVLLLSMNRYFTAAIGLGLAYVSDEIRVKAKATAQRHLTEHLFDNLFDANHSIWVLKQGVELEIPLAQVPQKDVVVIRAGETIPVDGVVVTGMASVDQQAFTGESYPVEKGPGENVFATTLVLSGTLHVQVSQSGQATAIAKIGDILTHSLKAKTETQLRGEQWAEAANLPFLALAGTGLLLYGPVGAAVILSGNTVQAIRTLAPLSTINYQAVASKHQVLIKQGQRLEQVSSIDVILFDKTGTLTDGQLQVSGIHLVHSAVYQAKDILFYAAVAEHKSTHPIAKAIINAAKAKGIELDNLDEIQYKLGYGIVVQFGNITVHVGSARFMAAEEICIVPEVEKIQATIHTQGHSLVMVAIEHQIAGIIELQARLRPEVPAVFAELRRRGVKQIGIVSGDHVIPTTKLAEHLGAEQVFAEVLPQDKASIVKSFQDRGHKVCFVGDGVNDAIAMDQADLSISLRGATSLATDVADIVLTDPNLSRLLTLWTLSERLEQNLKRGLGICYTGMGIVLLGTVFSHIDILVAMGVHFVLGSSAVGNSMTPLLEFKNRPDSPLLAEPMKDSSE